MSRRGTKLVKITRNAFAHITNYREIALLRLQLYERNLPEYYSVKTSSPELSIEKRSKSLRAIMIQRLRPSIQRARDRISTEGFFLLFRWCYAEAAKNSILIRCQTNKGHSPLLYTLMSSRVSNFQSVCAWALFLGDRAKWQSWCPGAFLISGEPHQP